ncbi:hypothetical protein QJS66_03150 [Kocuria rhizophila]|nr:hypothetical protein QJS66_03150 [Kocuria rhizophila]
MAETRDVSPTRTWWWTASTRCTTHPGSCRAPTPRPRGATRASAPGPPGNRRNISPWTSICSARWPLAPTGHDAAASGPADSTSRGVLPLRLPCRRMLEPGVEQPPVHTPERRKTWLACDEHRSTADFLGQRGFLKDVQRRRQRPAASAQRGRSGWTDAQVLLPPPPPGSGGSRSRAWPPRCASTWRSGRCPARPPRGGEHQDHPQNYDAAPYYAAQGTPLFEDYDESKTRHPVTLEGSDAPEPPAPIRNRPPRRPGGLRRGGPVRTAEGAVVAVDRGWIPTDNSATACPPPCPAARRHSVMVRLQPSEGTVDRGAPEGQSASDRPPGARHPVGRGRGHGGLRRAPPRSPPPRQQYTPGRGAPRGGLRTAPVLLHAAVIQPSPSWCSWLIR